VDTLGELIQRVISEIPLLLWPALVLLFLWGLVLISKQLYGLWHQARKNYITELKEHLNFKEMVINDISAQKVQLETQNNELRMEACRKDEIISATIKSAIDYVTEKDTELEKLKSDTDAIIRQFKFALGTALWVTERELFMRRMFLSLLAKSTVPTDIDEFLSKNIGPIVSMINSDEAIYNQQPDSTATSDYFESRATILSAHYLQLPIIEEISLFTNIKNEIMTLPSFINKDILDQDKK
jgi:hypothetical protein